MQKPKTNQTEPKIIKKNQTKNDEKPQIKPKPNQNQTKDDGKTKIKPKPNQNQTKND